MHPFTKVIILLIRSTIMTSLPKMNLIWHHKCTRLTPFLSRSFSFKSPLKRSSTRPIAFGSYEILTPASLGTQSITNSVPNSIRKPDYDPDTGYPLFIPSEIPIIKSDQELQQISNANALAKKILRFAGNLVQEGITTEFLDDAGMVNFS